MTSGLEPAPIQPSQVFLQQEKPKCQQTLNAVSHTRADRVAEMAANIVPFKKPKSSSRGLCQHGFHKWQVCKAKQFDTRQGKLVTVFRCSRCNKQKVKAL